MSNMCSTVRFRYRRTHLDFRFHRCLITLILIYPIQLFMDMLGNQLIILQKL